MDFGALPPEINSGRMYAGPGPAPLLDAAASWDELAAELRSAATLYSSVIDELASRSWQGPSSVSMTRAAAPFIAWMASAAAKSELTANQARTAAVAYETGFAATVPPPVVSANRSRLAALVATNLLGQNTPAIAATEAEYAEMWAQDATAMYAYAESSAAAAQLVPFTTPPLTTTDSGIAGQSATLARTSADSASSSAQSQLSQLSSQLTGALQTLATGTSTSTTSTPSWLSGLETDLSNLSTIVSTLTGNYSPIGVLSIPGGWWLTTQPILGLAQNGPGVVSLLSGAKPITGALAPLATELSSVAVNPTGSAATSLAAAVGRADAIGALSVPPRWAIASPQIRPVVSALTTDFAVPEAALSGETLQFEEMAMSSLLGRGIGAVGGRAVSVGAARTAGGAASADAAGTTMIVVVPPAKE
ncbi:PPE family protein [Mycobacterium intracellulare]|uniref:PPE family protein n=1 Tax=Mycobacterium intracellulare TaxID=1767 RepID=UPI001EEE4E3F|nr:PPE family protein [Mycobacterium intracellulare]MEE3750856.1 PPE family protein [Mycobacterium intracellulare]